MEYRLKTQDSGLKTKSICLSSYDVAVIQDFFLKSDYTMICHGKQEQSFAKPGSAGILPAPLSRMSHTLEFIIS